LIAVNFQAHLWSRNYALSRAHAKVSQVCALGGRDPGLLIFKNEQTVGNTVWSFEWLHPADPSYLYGAWISSSGAIELYSGDRTDKNSAAYDPEN